MSMLHTPIYLYMYSGSQAAFRRVYEEPILQSRMPTATTDEKDVGENRAKEVHVPCTFCDRVMYAWFTFDVCSFTHA